MVKVDPDSLARVLLTSGYSTGVFVPNFRRYLWNNNDLIMADGDRWPTLRQKAFSRTGTRPKYRASKDHHKGNKNGKTIAQR
ncbi:unnamed protein product [Fusarium venenatum]|uniref:Uncharacterized protein n=1 Tax=Fusarium venenatum TaxID=56646 RepID=A0A2L2SSA1_9HYPO|nr:uncharacterized protein FVRRES_04398 [Fusarium venenatum]CEI59962.1 unnamed protein product [Fusarium venenatum]